MLKIFIVIFFITTEFLNSANIIMPADFSKYPLPKKVTSKSHGGELPDKLAATDGIGAIILGTVGSNNNSINNKEYNKLLYNNLNKLDNNNSLNDLIANSKLNINLNKLNKINKNNFLYKYIEGQSCNDNNPNTINDVYTNGICKGVKPNNITYLSLSIQKYNDGGRYNRAFFKPYPYIFYNSNNKSININHDNLTFKASASYNINSATYPYGICNSFTSHYSAYKNNFINSNFQNVNYQCGLAIIYNNINHMDIKKVIMKFKIFNYNNSANFTDNYQRVTFKISYRNNGILKTKIINKIIKFGVPKIYTEEIILD